MFVTVFLLTEGRCTERPDKLQHGPKESLG